MFVEREHITANLGQGANGNRRSRLFTAAGTLMVALTFVGVGGFLTRNFLQNTLWKQFYYRNAISLAHRCEVKAKQTDDSTFPDLIDTSNIPLPELPHPRGFFVNGSDGGTQKEFLHAAYHCLLDAQEVNFGNAGNYITLGWVFGDHTTVLVNGRTALDIHGEEFVTLPLLPDDLAVSQLSIVTHVSGRDHHRFGMASIVPPVVTVATKDHLLAWAIQPLYEAVNVVQPLIPGIVLGTLLGFAWLLGIRTRIMLTGLFYFSTVIAYAFVMLSGPYVPFLATKVFTIAGPLKMLNEISLICLVMEIFGIQKKRIYSIMNASILATALFVVVLVAWDKVFSYSQPLNVAADAVFLVCYLAFLGVSFSPKLDTANAMTKVLTQTFVGLCILKTGYDLVRPLIWSQHLSFDFYLSFLVPLFVAGLVLNYLASVDGALFQTKSQKHSLSERLDVLQESLALLRSSAGNIAPFDHFVSERDGSNRWGASWSVSGSKIFLQGTVIGSAESAAPVLATIYTVLQTLRESGASGPERCLDALNRMLVQIYRHHAATTACALRVDPEGSLFMISFGVDLTGHGGRQIYQGISRLLGVEDTLDGHIEKLQGVTGQNLTDYKLEDQFSNINPLATSPSSHAA